MYTEKTILELDEENLENYNFYLFQLLKSQLNINFLMRVERASAPQKRPKRLSLNSKSLIQI